MGRKCVSTYSKVLYVAESSLGFHKVGISQNPPKRAAQLSVPNILDLRIVHTVPVMFAHKSEKLVHRALEDYRVSPEWFRLPEDVIRALCECRGERDLLEFCGVIVG